MMIVTSFLFFFKLTLSLDLHSHSGYNNKYAKLLWYGCSIQKYDTVANVQTLFVSPLAEKNMLLFLVLCKSAVCFTPRTNCTLKLTNLTLFYYV